MKNTIYQIVIGKYEFAVAIVKTTESQVVLHEQDKVTHFAHDSQRYADYIYEMQESGYKFKEISCSEFQAIKNEMLMNSTIAISLG